MAERTTALYLAGRLQVSDRAGNQKVDPFEGYLGITDKFPCHFLERIRCDQPVL